MAQQSLESTPPDVERARQSLQEGESLINNRQKLIKVADRSEHGWATVEEYVTDELAENSDDEKRLFKAETRRGRKLRASSKSKVKKPAERILPFGLSTACYMFTKLLQPLVRRWRSSGLSHYIH